MPGGICICIIIPHNCQVREVFSEVKHLLKTTQQPKPVGLPPTLDTGLGRVCFVSSERKSCFLSGGVNLRSALGKRAHRQEHHMNQ